MFKIESERLLMKHFSFNDADFIIELLNEDSFIKNITDKNVRTIADAHQYLRSGPMASYEMFGFGLTLVTLKECGTPIGMCGLLKREELPHADLGYALLPRFWGKGYAYEAAKTVLTYELMKHGLEKVLAVTSPTNISSNNLLVKLGFERIGSLELYGKLNNQYAFTLNV
ncbi:GNAT family N-acetyltransferase [Pseudoalteromonas sp. MMG005]|uniref:GNAT family N-acetyltransferase n=1 Tax=Pseudoalteromonas sp. MMG005 TaxID=2822682 RepID=UPI0032B32BB1